MRLFEFEGRLFLMVIPCADFRRESLRASKSIRFKFACLNLNVGFFWRLLGEGLGSREVRCRPPFPIFLCSLDEQIHLQEQIRLNSVKLNKGLWGRWVRCRSLFPMIVFTVDEQIHMNEQIHQYSVKLNKGFRGRWIQCRCPFPAIGWPSYLIVNDVSDWIV